MKIGFVLVNFNNVAYTKNAILSILDNKFTDTKIIIVDNSSQESDQKELSKLQSAYENVHIVFSGDNLGYFKGLNLGIKYMQDTHTDYQYMVIGNNDVLFPSNFIESIIRCEDRFKKYPVISPDIITIDGFHQNPHVIEKISKKREFIYDLYHLNYYLSLFITVVARLTSSFTDRSDEKQFDTAQEIYQGYGAMYILGPCFFKNFQSLWSPTFLMYEEFFLSKQLMDKVFKIYYEPTISLTHLMHASTDNLPGKVKWRFSKLAHAEYRKYIKVKN